MFDIAFSELVVIGVVALVVIGPERLPRVARTAGHLLGRMQRFTRDVKSSIDREMQLDELRTLNLISPCIVGVTKPHLHHRWRHTSKTHHRKSSAQKFLR